MPSCRLILKEEEEAYIVTTSFNHVISYYIEALGALGSLLQKSDSESISPLKKQSRDRKIVKTKRGFKERIYIWNLFILSKIETERYNNEIGSHALSEQILGRMLDVVIGERGDEVVAVIVVLLVADFDALDAGFLSGLFEVFGEELALLVEVVAGALV